MPILDIQVRARELGRIRIGQVVSTGNGKTRPSKLETFRFTSHSRELLAEVAAQYGGDVEEWQPQGGGAKAWQLLTPAKRVPILVPPQPVSQYYELWSGGGCQRRCDSQTEMISGEPCLCSAEPDERECKPTTRLNVMLRDVPGLGVWRLETHGYYAAAELPAVAEFLAKADGYIPGALVLEERTSKRNGQTRRYMVPAIEVEKVTPAQLMAGGGRIAPASIESASIESAGPAAIEAGGPTWAELIEGATTREELLGIRADAQRAKVPATVIDPMLAARAAELGLVQADQQAAPAEDVDSLWTKVLLTAPEGWSTADVEINFAKVTGVEIEQASAADMQKYLAEVAS